MSAHKRTPGTPGKWFVGQKVRDGSICVVGDIDSVVCEFGERLGGVEADARLIAAAPELLEACMAMLEWDDREKDHAVDFYARMDLCRAAFDKARAAIAKATGEPA